MATAEELVSQAKQAKTTVELDAIAAQAEDRKTVTEAVDARRAELANPPAPPATPPASSQSLGPNATTDPQKPEAHYFIASDGETKVNAWGEVKGSAEDRKRW